MADNVFANKPVTSGTNEPVVLSLRRAFYEDGRISHSEATQLFQIARHHAGDEAFAQFFVEALTDYVVRQVAPAGYVTHDTSAWLIKMMSRDGRVCSHHELSALVSILDAAILVPEDLVVFALKAVKTAVVTGDGRIMGQGYLEPGVIGSAEVALIRKIIVAAGGSGTIRVSRIEAEFLFDLNDAVANGDNDPDWTVLFSQSIGNYLMAANTYTPMPRERAEELEKWAQDTKTDSPGFIGKLFSGAPDFTGFFGGNKDRSKGVDPQDWYVAENERERAAIADAEVLTQDEAEWLVSRIGRDGVLNKNEVALLQFIKANSPSVHQKLQILFEQARPWNGGASRTAGQLPGQLKVA